MRTEVKRRQTFASIYNQKPALRSGADTPLLLIWMSCRSSPQSLLPTFQILQVFLTMFLNVFLISLVHLTESYSSTPHHLVSAVSRTCSSICRGPMITEIASQTPAQNDALTAVEIAAETADYSFTETAGVTWRMLI